MRIKQAWSARHRQNEAVGFNNLIIDTVHIIAVAGISRQILEGVMVINKRHSVALETIVPDESVIFQHTETLPAQVIKCHPDLLLQGEIKGTALEAALIIHTFNPILDITG